MLWFRNGTSKSSAPSESVPNHTQLSHATSALPSLSPSHCSGMDLRIGGTKGEDYNLREEHFTGNSNEIRKGTVTPVILITKVCKREGNSHAKMLTMDSEQW